MSTFINPFVDRGFKILFGQEVSKDLLVDFLSVQQTSTAGYMF